MRFLFHSWEFPPNGMGVGLYVKQMTTALTAAGNRCIVATGHAEGYPREEETPSGLVVRFYRRNEIGSQKVAAKVLALAREHRVDLIEGADHLGECSRLFRYKNRVPVIVKIHSSHALRVLIRSQLFYPWQYVTVSLALLRRWRQVRSEWRSMIYADGLHAPSKRVVQEMIKQGVPSANRCRVLPNPVSPIGALPFMKEKRPTALFVGRLDIGKGIVYLPRIMDLVWRKVPNTLLEIVGPDAYARGIGSMKQWLSRKFNNCPGQVRFLGDQDTVGLEEAYRRAWVVMVPSRWDNFPGVVLEAMARARAIVASPYGGMPEMLEDTDCIVADPENDAFAEAVCAFMAEPEKAYLAGLSACEKAVRDYHPTKIAQDYIKLARSICNGEGEWNGPT